MALQRVWDVLDGNEPVGPHWEIMFRRITPLAKPDAFLTAGLASSTLLKMFRHDPLTIWAVVVVVIDLPVSGRFFDGVGVVWRYLRHLILPSGGRMDAAILRRA
jgi:hypothetical protein